MSISNVEIIEEKKGRVLGSILLITGCCIGAAMIGLPVVAALSGLIPSIFVFTLAWAFMLSTGLLLLEVNLYFQGRVNLLSMADATLGKMGKYLCAFLFLFLFFSLLIAYLNGTGILVSDLLTYFTGWKIHQNMGIIFCAITLGAILIKGVRSVDIFNRILMLGMVVSYLFIILLGFPHVESRNLAYFNFGKQTIFAIPILIISFGYQNLIPSLVSYLKRDVKKLRYAITLGCTLPFLIYVFWIVIVLGMISSEQLTIMQRLGGEEFVTRLLQKSIASPYVVLSIQMFSSFALVTSLLAVALSCMDFLSEGIKYKNLFFKRIILCLAVITIPTVFSIVYPNLFLRALSMAGGLGAVILYGVLPVLMVWIGRYTKNLWNYRYLFGGKITLSVILILSVLIFVIEIMKQIGAI